MKRGALAAISGALLLGALSSGCVTTGERAKDRRVTPAAATVAVDSLPKPLEAASRKLVDEGERNEVLNLMTLGLEAYGLGYPREARDAFDRAISGIEAIYADDPQATKARSLWAEEGCKSFKGEPYERVMAYYYRGLLYIMENDLQNARASFKAGMLQDAFAEEDQHRCDFAMLAYLGGWCSQRISGDTLADEYLQETAALRPELALPDPAHNVLLIFETGTAPRKVADGVGHYQLKFRLGKGFTEQSVQFQIDGAPIQKAYLAEDLFWQASTRGGRQFDHILAGKAAFKHQSAAAGKVLGDVAGTTMVASTLFQDSASQIQGVGAGIGLVSVVSQLASSRARAEADTRSWSNLPHAVHVASLFLSPGNHTLTAWYLDREGRTVAGLGQEMKIAVPENGQQLVWIPSRMISRGSP